MPHARPPRFVGPLFVWPLGPSMRFAPRRAIFSNICTYLQLWCILVYISNRCNSNFNGTIHDRFVHISIGIVYIRTYLEELEVLISTGPIQDRFVHICIHIVHSCTYLEQITILTWTGPIQDRSVHIFKYLYIFVNILHTCTDLDQIAILTCMGPVLVRLAMSWRIFKVRNKRKEKDWALEPTAAFIYWSVSPYLYSRCAFM